MKNNKQQQELSIKRKHHNERAIFITSYKLLMQEFSQPNQSKFKLPPAPKITLIPPVLKDYRPNLTTNNLHLHLHLLNNNNPQYTTPQQQLPQNHIIKLPQSPPLDVQQRLSNLGPIPQLSPPEKIEQMYTICEKCKSKMLTSQLEEHLLHHVAIIFQNLFLGIGNRVAAQSLRELRGRNGVTHVVNAAAQLENYLEKDGLTYCNLELYDIFDEEIIPELEKAYHFIKQSHQNGGKVFVHCALGKSRSVSVILIYLLKQKGIGIKQGLKLIKQKRPIAQPNLSYMKKLLEYQKDYKQKLQKCEQPNPLPTAVSSAQKLAKQEHQG